LNHLFYSAIITLHIRRKNTNC